MPLTLPRCILSLAEAYGFTADSFHRDDAAYILSTFHGINSRNPLLEEHRSVAEEIRRSCNAFGG